MIRLSKLSKQGVGGREAAASLSVTLDRGTKVCWHIAGRKKDHAAALIGREEGKKGIPRPHEKATEGMNSMTCT